jgi:hypothetical protein
MFPTWVGLDLCSTIHFLGDLRLTGMGERWKQQ